jgi:hypothetical protein
MAAGSGAAMRCQHPPEAIADLQLEAPPTQAVATPQPTLTEVPATATTAHTTAVTITRIMAAITGLTMAITAGLVLASALATTGLAGQSATVTGPIMDTLHTARIAIRIPTIRARCHRRRRPTSIPTDLTPGRSLGILTALSIN